MKNLVFHLGVGRFRVQHQLQSLVNLLAETGPYSINLAGKHEPWSTVRQQCAS